MLEKIPENKLVWQGGREEEEAFKLGKEFFEFKKFLLQTVTRPKRSKVFWLLGQDNLISQF